jgi:hypothetical protein
MDIYRSAAMSHLSKLPLVGTYFNEAYKLYLNGKYRFNASQLRRPRRAQDTQTLSEGVQEVQQKIVAQLKDRGICTVQFSDLFMGDPLWDQLTTLSSSFEEEARRLIRSIERPSDQQGHLLDHNLEKLKRYYSDSASARGDDYLLKLYPEDQILTWDNPLLRMALNDHLLSVVNSYLGFWSKLIYVDMWRTLPASPSSRVGSQKWHRDREDRKMIKAYLYFTDVSAGAGPIEYVLGSNSGGRYATLCPWRDITASLYPPGDEIEHAVSPDHRILGVGPSGALILCDTSGLHRGGMSVDGFRLSGTWTFVSPASPWPRRFRLGFDVNEMPLSAQARFAITE